MLDGASIAITRSLTTPLKAPVCRSTASCELIAVETNRYAFVHVRRGCPIGGEIVAFAVSVVGGCFCLCLNSTFTDAVKNFIQVLYLDQTLHLKCLEVQCTG